MAQAAKRILQDPALAERLQSAALADVQQYAWPQVRRKWNDIYGSVLAGARMETRPA
jgi:glycosyltransferase involved in cell wall biosynthesis